MEIFPKTKHFVTFGRTFHSGGGRGARGQKLFGTTLLHQSEN